MYFWLPSGDREGNVCRPARLPAQRLEHYGRRARRHLHRRHHHLRVGAARPEKQLRHSARLPTAQDAPAAQVSLFFLFFFNF